MFPRREFLLRRHKRRRAPCLDCLLAGSPGNLNLKIPLILKYPRFRVDCEVVRWRKVGSTIYQIFYRGKH